MKNLCNHANVSYEPGDGSFTCNDCGANLNTDPDWPRWPRDFSDFPYLTEVSIGVKQTHKASWSEAVFNTVCGFIVAVVANYAVLPWFGYVPKFIDSIQIAILFTLISIPRSYLVRRLFEALRIKGILK